VGWVYNIHKGVGLNLLNIKEKQVVQLLAVLNYKLYDYSAHSLQPGTT